MHGLENFGISALLVALAEMGDRTESVLYRYDLEIVLAVNVALATQRPLLVSGPSGCGKSSLAADIADVYMKSRGLIDEALFGSGDSDMQVDRHDGWLRLNTPQRAGHAHDHGEPGCCSEN